MKETKITADQCKDTGLAIILILLLIDWLGEVSYCTQAAILVLLITMTIPKLLTPLAHLWFGLSHLMGEVVSKVLLTLVFVVIATPTGLFRKLLGKDSMRLKAWKKGNDSVFVDRSHTFTAEDVEKPF